MSFLAELPEILREAYNLFYDDDFFEYRVIESYGGVNHLCFGENLNYIKWLISKGYTGKINLIYIDPPFFSGSDYAASIKLKDDTSIKVQAYGDIWNNNLKEYLIVQLARVIGMRELLSEDGSIWVHLDHHVSHYFKILLDEIFGRENFVNEIIWQYKSGGSGKRHFSRKHDTILFYSKTKKYYLNLPKEKSYNRGLKPYKFKNVKEYEDDKGWYTLVNMKDIWAIDMVGRTSAERTGYATQKPVALMERIIAAASKEGDICADFFVGSASFPVAASNLGRRWLACESGKPARTYSISKLLKAEIPFDILGKEDIQDNFNLDDLRISKKDKKRVAEALAGDGDFLNSITSVDLNYRGDVHRDSLHYFDGYGKALASGDKKNMSIVTYDVFGNRVHTVVKDE